MKIWDGFQKKFVIATAASYALQSLIQRQQDLSVGLPDGVLLQRYRDSAKLAAGFGYALWEELKSREKW